MAKGQAGRGIGQRSQGEAPEGERLMLTRRGKSIGRTASIELHTSIEKYIKNSMYRRASIESRYKKHP